ncbi:STAS domain-containing protein [Streptomyces sp. NPDC059556]|uniref:STAS domain-containing protein n=1 Tax=Streptomyces sp. NPDC059556 TaxID=3346863 RepID=UPI0036C7EE7C
MNERAPQWGDTCLRLVLVSGMPAWRSASGAALVRYEPSASPATVTLSASGEFDADSVDCLHEAVACVCTPQTERILLDLTGVTFADSAFVSELLATRHRCPRLILVGPLPTVVSLVLDAAGVRGVFHIALEEGLG